MSKPLPASPVTHLPERGMSESRHTPTPWRLFAHAEASETDVFKDGRTVVADISGATMAVAYTDYGTEERAHANAAFIVTACNSYAAMKAALMGIIARPDIQPDDGTELPPWLRRVYDALAKAEGKV